MWTLLALMLGPLAHAADVSIGLVGGVAVDLPDVESIRHTRFGPGPWGLVPVRVQFNDHVALVSSLRVDWGTGRDRLSWTRTVDGTDWRFVDDDHDAWFLGVGLTVGPEAILPIGDRVFLNLGAEAGVLVGWTFHVLGQDSMQILDPALQDGGLDPYTTQASFLTEVHAGGGVHLTPALAVTLETGYSVAFFGAGKLLRSDPDLAAEREPFAWNALRAGLGLRITL